MLATLNVLACTAGKPNIVLALTDDLGWNYPGYHGTPSDTITPTLDQLAMQEGVRLGACRSPARNPSLRLADAHFAALLVPRPPRREFLRV